MAAKNAENYNMHAEYMTHLQHAFRAESYTVIDFQLLQNNQEFCTGPFFVFN